MRCFANSLPFGIKFLQFLLGLWVAFTPFRNKASNRILVGEIVFCGFNDGRRRRKPDALPSKAPLDGPGKDAGPFLLEFFCEVRVPFCFLRGPGPVLPAEW
jgi:hypothetical protein